MPDSSAPIAPTLTFNPAKARLPDNGPEIDMRKLRSYRLDRIRAGLKQRDYAGILLYDPLNIRYATDSRNMAVWTAHNAVRYAFIATEGPVVIFDFHNCEFLSEHLDLVDEVRLATPWYYFGAGPNGPLRAKEWAAEIADLVRSHGGGNRRLAVDKCDPMGVAALTAEGIEIKEGQEVTELARSIKSAEEIACMRRSIAVCEAAVGQMRQHLRPGILENELWAILNYVNAANDGEWIETRLLSAGGRTNPWFRECGPFEIQAGDLVSFDTDMVGPYSYCSDISRTFYCGGGKPSDDQRRLYQLAWEQIHVNMDIIKPGMTFFEVAEKSWKLPESCRANRYSVVMHGVGLADEFPHIGHSEDLGHTGYDGIVEPGMTLCVESYIGEEGGKEGVKLEQQVLITEKGAEPLSTFPFEENLLAKEI